MFYVELSLEPPWGLVYVFSLVVLPKLLVIVALSLLLFSMGEMSLLGCNTVTVVTQESL